MRADLLSSKSRRVGLALVCAKAILVPLTFDRVSDQAFIVPKALLSHSLSYALALLLGGLFIQYGRGFLVPSRVHVPVIAFFAANALATAFAVDPRLALYGVHNRMLGLGTIADWIVLYFSVVHLVRTRWEALRLLGAVLAPTPVVLAYEAIQLGGRDPFTWSGDVASRPISTLGQSTVLGPYLMITAAALLVLAVRVPNLRPWQRVAMCVWVTLVAAGAVGTGTRAIVLAAGAALGAVILAVVLTSASRRTRTATAVVAVAAAAVMVLLVAVTPLGGRVAATIVGNATGDVEVDPSTVARLDLYRIALGELVERPLFGYGPDSFVVGVPRYRTEAGAATLRGIVATSAHGWIPFIATSSGLLGLSAFLGILAIASRALLRAASEPAALAGAAMATAFLGAGLTTIDDIGVDWLFWVGLALIVVGDALRVASPAPAPAVSRTQRRPRGSSRNARANAPAVGLALGAVAIVLSTSAWGASRSAGTSQTVRLTRAGSPVEPALAAVRDDPGRAEYWRTLGLAHVSAQRWRDASSAFGHAAALAPYDISHLGDEIQAEIALAASGDSAAGARALRLSDTAVRSDPNNPKAQLLRATTFRALGDNASAEPPVRRALALDPASTSEPLYIAAVQILVANGRADDAIAVAQEGLTHLPAAVVLRLELARAFMTARRYFEALGQVENVLATHPDLRAAQDLRAQIQAAMR